MGTPDLRVPRDSVCWRCKCYSPSWADGGACRICGNPPSMAPEDGDAGNPPGSPGDSTEKGPLWLDRAPDVPSGARVYGRGPALRETEALRAALKQALPPVDLSPGAPGYAPAVGGPGYAQWTHTGEKRTENPAPSGNPKDAIGDTKPQMHLIPAPALIQAARVMELGAKKYGPYNWRGQPVRMTVYLAAAMRHILAKLDGQDLDPESGQPHEAHALACMAILLDAAATGNVKDDRPPVGAAAKLLAATKPPS